MSRDMMRTIDAIDRAAGINRGLDVLAGLLLDSNRNQDVNVHDLGELLGSVQKDLDQTLKEAAEGLKQSR